jgi:hypothetical protein
MKMVAIIAVLGALSLSLAGCGGGREAADDVPDEVPGQSVNAGDGINTSDDASGTTGSSTGDAGGALNIAGDAANDSADANGTASNQQ